MDAKNLTGLRLNEASAISAKWDGEDWVFDNVPLTWCANWRGHTCFSPRELGYTGSDPKVAIQKLQEWVEEGRK